MSSIPANHRSVLRLVHDEIADRHAPRAGRRDNLALTHYLPDNETERITARIIEESRKAALNPHLDPTDPRWMLASATKNALDGCAINPTKRTNLLRLATKIGMRSFDANLVIAIVQDQARQPANIKQPRANINRLAHRLRIIPDPATSSITTPTIPVPFTQRIEPVEYIDNQPALINKRFFITITAITLLTTTILTLLINWLLTSV